MTDKNFQAYLSGDILKRTIDHRVRVTFKSENRFMTTLVVTKTNVMKWSKIEAISMVLLLVKYIFE